VDVSIQSATKYINGHSDVMLGIACANQATWPQLDQRSYELGLCASFDDLYTTLRGIRTLGVRLRQHKKNAMMVAKWLEQRSEVDHIRHPAFNSCPGHAEFKRDFKGSTGLFSFVMNKGDQRDVAAMLEGMQYFKMGFSWGGFESLVISPSDLESKRSVTKWSAAGPLIRLHVGLEDPADLIEDLDKGFERFNAHIKEGN
jgi:cystathionine beta-lyase